MIRDADEADIATVVTLAGAALGWRSDEPNEALFRWKHLDNPAGVSPMWVAQIDGEVVGFRTFLRWRFRRPGDVEAVDAVRAVDTATHPDHQGRGVFSMLTRHAVAALTDGGTGFVFNTPNAQSRPGYLKMGWVEAGSVPIRARLRRPWRLRGARKSADKWSLPTASGSPVEVVVPGLTTVGERGIATERSGDYLAWRYGFEPLHYRGFDHDEGQAVFRLRRRGGATECTVCEHVGSGAVLAELLRHSGADYLVAARSGVSGGLPVPWAGPMLTTRDLAESAPKSVADFAFALGDIELF